MTRLMVRCPQNSSRARLLLLAPLSVPLIPLLLLVLSSLPQSVDASIAGPEIVIVPIVSLTKTVSPQAATPGQVLVYTLTVTNTSTVSYTQGLVVTDTIPANTVFEDAVMLPAGAVDYPDYHSTGTVIFTPTAQLAPSGTLQVQLKVLVAEGLRDGTPIVNDDYGVSEAQSGAVMGSPVTATIQAPALTVAKEADDLQVCDGRRVGYTIRVTNTGHLTSNGPFTVTDRLPAATFYAQSSPAGTFDAMSGLITWTLTSPLAPAQSALVSFAVTNPITTPLGTLLVNDQYSAVAPDVPDAAIGVPVTVTAINMRVGFTSTAHAYTGQPVTFFNTSTGAIYYYLWDYGDGSFLETPPQPTHTYTQEGNYTVILTATGPCGTVAARQTLTVTTSMVSLSKSAKARRITAGGTLAYTLTITNTSTTHDTTALTVTDTVPADTTFESAGFVAPASGDTSIPPVGGMGVITWTPNAQLAPGSVMQLLLMVKVAADALPQTVITNETYAVSEARSGVVTGEPVTSTVILPSAITLIAVPASVPVAHSAAVTATVYDQDGLPVVGGQVSFSTTDALGLGAIVPPVSTTDSNGRATAVISSTLPGVKGVLAQTSNLSATISVTFRVAAGEPYTVTLTADPITPWVAEMAHLTATVTDQAGNRLSGQVITFSSPNSFGTALLSAIVPLTATTDSNGQVTATVFSLIPGDKLIIATAPNGVTGMMHVTFRAIIFYTFVPLVMQSDLSPPEASLPGDSTNMGEPVNVIDRQSGLDH